MPKKTKRTTQQDHKVDIGLRLGQNSSGHLVTSRPEGSTERFVILTAIGFLAIMLIFSVFSVVQAYTNPAVWATFIFLAGIMAFILFWEDNMFPSLNSQKMLYAIGAWFLTFLTIPYVIVLMKEFNFAMMLFVSVLLVIQFPLYMRLLTTDDRWELFKNNVKDAAKRGADATIPKRGKNLKKPNKNRKIHRK